MANIDAGNGDIGDEDESTVTEIVEAESSEAVGDAVNNDMFGGMNISN